MRKAKCQLHHYRISILKFLIATLTIMTSMTGAATEVKNVVLVHGAWADGSSWSKVIPLLQAQGLHVMAVQNPLTSTADDIAATKRIIDAQDGPTLLVGHSSAGAIISAAGENPKVAGLMFIAAFAPDQGETLSGIAQAYPKAPLFDEITPIEDGYLLLTDKGFREDFAQDLTDAEKNVLIATQTATANSIFSTPLPNAAWHTKPNWFIVAANDRSISPDLEKDTAKKINATTLIAQSSHVVMLAQPELTANFILSAVHSLKSLSTIKNAKKGF